jgi:ADP-ribosylglycohydrolase
VLTVAVADALMSDGDFKGQILKYAKRYPNRGFGGRFRDWMAEKDPQPYGSFGNGSAMRVSPVAWFHDDMEGVLKAARETASVTHNHPEGVKGAQATAAAILLARQGADKLEIKSFVEKTFEYNLNREIKDIRPGYQFDSSCAGSVPEAIIAFLESVSYEDTVRTAISLGGDTDTQAAIAGSIAEAYYGGVPQELKDKAMTFLTKDIADVALRFHKEYIKPKMRKNG